MQLRTTPRGQQGMIGTVILIGLVMGGSVLVVFFGSSLLTQLQQDATDRSATGVLQEVDSELQTLSTGSGGVERQLSFGELNSGSTSIREKTGTLTVTVTRWRDESSKNTVVCEKDASVDLNTLRYETSDGNVVAYQAGGIWQDNRDGGSGMVSPPDVEFNGGRIQIGLTNPAGEATSADPTAELTSTKSIGNSLFQGKCRRPHAITLTVESEYHDAWASYLEDEFGTSAARPSSQTVSVTVGNDRLARISDDERNDVVDLETSSVASFMSSVTVGGASDPNLLTVAKSGHGGNYDVTVNPLSKGELHVSQPHVKQSTNTERKGLDVVFVVDESGSMSNDANPSASDCGDGDDSRVDWIDDECQSKASAAREAIKKAITNEFDSSIDEVGLVGFYQPDESPIKPSNPDYPRSYTVDCQDAKENDEPGEYAAQTTNYAKIYKTDGEQLTSDFSKFKGTTLSRTRACGGTYASGGLRKANALLQTRGDPEDKQVIILLSDGKNTDTDVWFDGEEQTNDEWTEAFAAKAENELNFNIYSVGFGQESELDESLLQEVANHNHDSGVSDSNDDYYYAENGDELVGVFDRIVQRVTKANQLRRVPLSADAKLGSGGSATIERPTIPGDTDAIDTENGYVNVNDPAAPLLFRQAFGATDGKELRFRTFTYDCTNWQPTDRYRAHAGDIYRVQRCAELGSRQQTIGDDAGEIRMYTDGDSTTSLFSGALPWWQENLRSSIEDTRGVSIDEATDRFEMHSNRAIVVFTIPSSGSTPDNKLALLVEVGKARETTTAESVLDFQTATVEIDG